MAGSRHSPRLGEAALVVAHRDIATHIARDYYLQGGDRDDVEQEALIGLLIGIRTYDPLRGALRPFLKLTVRRWLMYCVRSRGALNQQPLTNALRTVMVEEQESLGLVAESLLDPLPLELVVEQRERLRLVLAALPRLTDLERRSLAHIINGGVYKEGPRNKRLENAVDRARRKLRAAA